MNEDFKPRMHSPPEMYTRDSKGKVRRWKIQVIEKGGYATVAITANIFPKGKETIRSVDVSKGKNLGKVNATTYWTQAIRDAEGKILKKEREGYKTLLAIGKDALADPKRRSIITSNYPDISDAADIPSVFIRQNLATLLPKTRTDKSGGVKPMKAQQYWTVKRGKTVPRIKFPCLGQPKINGFRCFCKVANGYPVFTSKNGITFSTLAHLSIQMKAEAFKYTVLDPQYDYSYVEESESLIVLKDEDFVQEFSAGNVEEATALAKEEYGIEINVMFDGEMYIEGFILSDIASAVKKMNLYTGRLEFHIFDLAIPNFTQAERSKMLKEIYNEHFKDANHIKLVPTFNIRNHQIAQQACDKFIEIGHEGAIFRAPEAHYKFGSRPVTMVKLKKRFSGEFKILDIVDTQKAPGLAIMICQNDINRETFRVNPEGDTAKKREYFFNKQAYIGKDLTVEYYERTKAPKEIPFHTVGIAVRDYE